MEKCFVKLETFFSVEESVDFYSGNVNHMTTSLAYWSACLTADHGVAGSIPGIFTNFKCGLDLERGPPSLVRTIGQLLD